MRFIRSARPLVILWAAVLVLSVICVAAVGLNRGIDFTGGTLLERGLPNNVTSIDVQSALQDVEEIDIGSTVIQNVTGDNEEGTIVIIRTGELTNGEIAVVDEALAEQFSEVDNRRTEVVGPVVGSELVRQSIWALVLAAVGVLVYVSFRFEYRFGIAAIGAVLHDVFVVLAVLALLRTEIDTPFVAAILTVVGYTLNNTIVIFDRVRENLSFRKKESLLELLNKSIAQTLSRSINTSITTMLVLLSLLLLGGATIRDFTLTLLLGVVVGTVSSLFFAPALWLIMQQNVKQSGSQT